MYQCEVQEGETLISISIREKVSIAVLRRLNGLYGNMIYGGQILNLRSKPKPIEPADSSSAVDDNSSDIAHRDSSVKETKETSGRAQPTDSAMVTTTSLSQRERKRLLEKEEFDKIPPTLLGEKKILQVEHAHKLRCFLPSMQQIESWKLLYSVLNDGADLGTFFRRSKEHKYTLLIVETMKGEIFGGFNSMEWTTSPNFCKFKNQFSI